MSTMPPSMPPHDPAAAPAKKRGPLFWILIGLGGFALLGILAIGALSIFAYRMIRDVDTSGNPAFAAAKLALRLNPNLEVLSEDPAHGSITVRDKSSGEVVTMAVDPDTKQFSINTQNGKASVDIQDGHAVFKGQDGSTVDIGEGGSLPSWLPVYPGTQPTGAMRAESGGNLNTSFTFKSSDSPEKVLGFYKEKLMASGFVVPTTMIQPTGGMLMAQDEANKRDVVVTVSESGDTVLSVTERK